MISRVLIFVYILCVLLFAGFARAGQLPAQDTIPLEVTNIQYQSDSWLLHISGYMSHPCTSRPFPVLNHSEKQGQTIVLRVLAREFEGLCIQNEPGIQKISDEFDLAFDLRTLFEENDHLNFEKGVTYKLVVANYENFELEVDPGEMVSPFPFSTVELNGILIQLDDGSFALETSQHRLMSSPSLQQIDFNSNESDSPRFIAIVAPESVLSDLKKYLDQPVSVSGHLFVNGLPVESAEDLELTVGSPQAPYSQLLVTGISPNVH